MSSFPTYSPTFCSLFSFFTSLSIFRPRQHSAPAESRHATPARLEPSAAINNLEGTTIGSYNLISELDRGTFAAVYYCNHVITGRFYAAKLYTPQWVRTQTGNQTIHEELTVMKLLNHRNTTFFQDVIFTNHGVLIVMELVQGNTLLEILPAGHGIIEHFARHIFVQFLDGLEYLHRTGILHRDIKLENVMIDYDGNVKIIDYGMAKYIPRCKKAEHLLVTERCGSNNYFAPEIYSNTRTGFRGDKTDVWTSGVMLFCLVIGSFPFHHDKEEEMERQILNCESWIKYWTKSDTTVSLELKHLFRKIFVKDPMKRPSVAELKQHPWIKGTKMSRRKHRISVFTSASGNVSVSFANRKAERSLSWHMESSRPASLQSENDATRKANTHGSSSSPVNACPEAKIEKLENGRSSYETVSIALESEPAPSRKRKVREALRSICETPKRVYTKIRMRKEDRRQNRRHGNQTRAQDRRGREHAQDAGENRGTHARANNRTRVEERKRRRTGTPARFWSRRDSRKPIATASVSRLGKNGGVPNS